MEAIVTIQQQLPLQQRDYIDKAGQPQQFKVVGFILKSGFDTFFAEAVQEQAETFANYPTQPNTFYKAQLTASARNFVDAKGLTRWQTELRITKLVPM